MKRPLWRFVPDSIRLKMDDYRSTFEAIIEAAQKWDEMYIMCDI